MNEVINVFINFLIAVGAFTCIMAVTGLLVSAYKIHKQETVNHLPQIKDAIHRI